MLVIFAMFVFPCEEKMKNWIKISKTIFEKIPYEES